MISAGIKKVTALNKAKQTKLKQTKTNQEKPDFCLPFVPVLLTWFFALFMRCFCGSFIAGLLPVTWISLVSTGENIHLLTAGSLFAGLLLKTHRTKYSPLTRKADEI